MGKYRKKPVVVEATQWFKNGDVDDVKHFPNPADADQDFMWKDCNHCGEPLGDHGWIDTLEGGHIVCPGDWVITGVRKEKYPCKPDIFEATYEPVEAR